jgi:hypothetical protein
MSCLSSKVRGSGFTLLKAELRTLNLPEHLVVIRLTMPGAANQKPRVSGLTIAA